MRRSHLQRLPSFRKCTGTNAASGWDGFWNQSHMKVLADFADGRYDGRIQKYQQGGKVTKIIPRRGDTSRGSIPK